MGKPKGQKVDSLWEGTSDDLEGGLVATPHLAKDRKAPGAKPPELISTPKQVLSRNRTYLAGSKHRNMLIQKPSLRQIHFRNEPSTWWPNQPTVIHELPQFAQVAGWEIFKDRCCRYALPECSTGKANGGMCWFPEVPSWLTYGI